MTFVPSQTKFRLRDDISAGRLVTAERLANLQMPMTFVNPLSVKLPARLAAMQCLAHEVLETGCPGNQRKEELQTGRNQTFGQRRESWRFIPVPIFLFFPAIRLTSFGSTLN
jgi:hypothetical protein